MRLRKNDNANWNLDSLDANSVEKSETSGGEENGERLSPKGIGTVPGELTGSLRGRAPYRLWNEGDG